MSSNLIGKKIIARIDRAGVFHGVLEHKDAETTRLSKVRRIYYWEGPISVTDMSVVGVRAGSKVTLPAMEVEFQTASVVELIACDKKASEAIEAITPWIKQ